MQITLQLMIGKKKNIQQLCKSTAKVSSSASGLFSSKNAKQNLLEQLRKGTLFNLDPRHPEDRLKDDQYQNQQEELWLNQIKLASEEEDTLDIDPPLLKYIHKTQKQLPIIGNLPKKQVPNPKVPFSRRCDKMTCFEKKLKTTAAWNKQNPNRIDSNLSKLASTLKSTHSQLAANDFYRVPGYKERSFDQSIMSASLDLLVCQPNPLGNISFMESSVWERRRVNKFWRASRRRKWHKGQGEHVPQFLMSSLLLQSVESRGRRS